MKEQQLANGIQTLYTYDNDRNIATLTTKTKDETILLNYTYTYDRNDNQLSREGSTDSQNRLEELRFYDDKEQGKERYIYDAGKLTLDGDATFPQK